MCWSFRYRAIFCNSTLWDEIKNCNSKQREIGDKFNKIMAKWNDSFCSHIQNELFNISESYEKNEAKREQLKDQKLLCQPWNQILSKNNTYKKQHLNK